MAFATKGRLNAHQGTKIHQGDKPGYKCSKCDRGFALKGNLDDHLIRHTGERAYLCQVCKKPFVTKGEMNSHKKRMHTGKDIRCTDPSCVWKGCSQTELIIHMRKHSGEKPYTCPLDSCGKEFPTRSLLNKHRRFTHNSKDFISIECFPSISR
jgi:KRAB domain-containing zinc finger protein